jgi:hypothetical protein
MKLYMFRTVPLSIIRSLFIECVQLQITSTPTLSMLTEVKAMAVRKKKSN